MQSQKKPLQKRVLTSIRNAVTTQLFILCAAASLLSAQIHLQSGDGYVRREGNEWIIGTASVERRVRLNDGHLELVSLRNKLTSREYQDSPTPPAETRFLANGEDTSAPAWRWELRGEHAAQGPQGELQLDIDLESAGIHATRHYVIYPGTSVIREWLTLENISTQPVHITHLEFLHTRLLSAAPKDLQFNYLTGGGNYNGSQLLTSEPMGPSYARTLDSNGGVQPGNYSSYLPLVFLLDRQTPEGIAIGWDYLGHWRFQAGGPNSTPSGMSLELAGFEKNLASRAKIETPKAFLATFSGGVDELGNQLLDWQYAYLWDFTNPDYFAKTRWAVDWPDP